jgi:hypothetical protein
MEVFVRGARSDSRDWSAAQGVSLTDLPRLTEKEKEDARQGNMSEERYARKVYAEGATQKKLLQRLLKFGEWLNARAEERNPGVQIEKVELYTLSGRIEITLLAGGETVDFEMDEDLVERFLTTGSAESESAIFRLLDVYVPKQRVAKAS